MAPSTEGPRSPPFSSTRKCILVVEDELLIRMMVSDGLRDTGHDVIEAANADEALTVLTARVRIDLIFSDVRMPGSIDGLGLLAFVKENFPTLPVIITSAHLEPGVASAEGATQFLAKPYLLETVVSAVRDELTRNS